MNSIKPAIRFLTVSLGLLFAFSCTDADLEPVPPPDDAAGDNKLTVEGEFCTTDPNDVRFPVKLLFVIDASTSMTVTDPEALRVDAMIEVIDALQGVEGVEYGVISFGLGANILTERCDSYDPRENCAPGFTGDYDEAIQGAAGAALANGTTDYTVALDTMISMLASDMAASTEEDLVNSRYIIMWLSDGIPDADAQFNPNRVCDDATEWLNTQEAPEGDQVEVIEDRLDDIVELARRYDVREMSFNGAFLAAPGVTPIVKACGSTLIHAMSQAGGGVFRDFGSGEAINFLFVDFTSYKRIFALKNLVVTNLNARPFSEALYVDGEVLPGDPTLAAGIIDSDGDGLTDEQEELHGSSIYLQDSDGDGFSDLLEFNLRTSGFDTLDPTDADCVAEIDRIDTDGDGLRDCEERFAGTNPIRFDSDLDGFGDGMEYLYGSNPAIKDGLLDVDFDGADNGREIRWHSQPDSEDIAFLSDHAYRYEVTQGQIENAQICYSFSVSNISLASSKGAHPPLETRYGFASPGLGGGEMEAGTNRILLEVAETPFDTPNEPGISRIACVEARFDAERRLKDPANGVIEVGKASFVDARAFDPTIDCVLP